MQAAVIVLQRQHIVTTLRDHPGRDGTLAVKRIGGDDAATQRQRFQQLGDRRDLVAFAIDGYPTGRQSLVHRPGAQHVQWRSAGGAIERTQRDLAVNGDLGEWPAGRGASGSPGRMLEHLSGHGSETLRSRFVQFRKIDHAGCTLIPSALAR